MLTVIVPHGHPDFSANILANFRRQHSVNAQLLVVENGDAIGTMSTNDAIVIRSDAHQSDAMNGGGSWARFDNDDYYGPDYLMTVKKSLIGDEPIISGMPWRFTMLDDGLHQFNSSGEFTGGTLAANNSDVELFPRISGEDLEWCRIMRKKGIRLVQREPWGYCYDRTTRKAKRVIWGGSAVTRYAFGPSMFYGTCAMNSVDNYDLQPLCLLQKPSNNEIYAEMCSSPGVISLEKIFK